MPPVEATDEFKVMTNTYDAQYGRTGGGIVNVTLKSGGNDLHGTVYEFLRRYQLDANTIENNTAGRPRYAVDPATGRNLGGHLLDDFGTMLSGPVWIPGVYNGRDKTFFLFNVQGYRERAPAPGITSVPTLLERQGDFSQSGVTIWDPLTTRPNPSFDPSRPESASNPLFIRDPFLGNRIPADRINPIGSRIANAFPEPNFGPPGARFNNFLLSPNLERERFRSWIGRVDQNFGSKERMYFRYVHNRRDQFAVGANRLVGLGLDAQDPLVRINDGGVIDSVTTLSAKSILNLRASYTRFVQAAFRTRSSPFDATTLGFPAEFSQARPVSIVPRFQFDQYPEFGPRNPSENVTNTLSFQSNLSRIAGRHSYKVGMEIRDIRANQSGASFSWGGGLFVFSRDFTQRIPRFSEAASGGDIASLLLGYPTRGQVDSLAAPAFRWGYYAFYVQDDVKVTPRLTFNLGFRYDYESAPTERYNRMNRGFAFTQTNPLAERVRNAPGASECPTCADLRGGLVFAGVGGQPRPAFDADKRHFQPRVGVAYQPMPRTVLRGGYGIYYLPQAEFGGSTGFSVTTPLIATIGGGAQQFIPATTLLNPFPSGLVMPTGASLGLLTQAGTDIIFNLPSRRIPRVHQFSFGVQHELPWQVKVDASYAGSRSTRLLTNDFNIGAARNINANTVEQLVRARQDPRFFTESVPNPFAGLLPGTPLNSATIPRQQLLRPYPQFGAVIEGLENVGKLWYNAFQLSVEKRFSAGLVLVSSYTLSKEVGALGFLNDQDPTPTHTLDASDRTHRWVFSGVYQLPFGKGRQYASGIGRGLDLLIGGWEYNWIAVVQSGTPTNYPGNVDLLTDPRLGDRNLDRYFNTCVLQLNGTSRQPNARRNGFEPCNNPAWAIRGPNTLRTIPFRSGQLRDPWAPQFDMSLNKSFLITERYRAQFRLESFNSFNTPIFGGPNTDPNSTNFGLVTRGQRNFPRQVQLGFKFVF